MDIPRWVFLVVLLDLLCTTCHSSDSSVSSNGSPELPQKLLGFAESRDFSERMIGSRRKIHENPEFGLRRVETIKLIRSELDKMGIRCKHPLAVTGVVGFIGTGKPPPFVALRADMDALLLELAEEGGGGAKKMIEAGALDNVACWCSGFKAWLSFGWERFLQSGRKRKRQVTLQFLSTP